MRFTSTARPLVGLILVLSLTVPFWTACTPTVPGGNGNSNMNGNDNDPPPPQSGDTDNDGVRNDDDLCSGTMDGAEVDENGCAASQRDTDDDGVTDDQDDCPATPSNVTVDADGCPLSAPGTPDADQDGVNDDLDQCPDTSTEESVDMNGCGPSQRDTDGDGVTDNLDRCRGTTSGTEVDDRGCPVTAPGAADADEDGIIDADDQCPSTPPDMVVSPDGCADSQLDSDMDGVNDEADLCPDTLMAAQVDADGCSAAQLDLDGDGVPNDRDQCAGTPMGTTVDAAGCPTSGGGGGGSVCGNATLEAGEQCDPPNGTTCDPNCQNTTGGELVSDGCATPISISGNVDRNFSTNGAATDGPDEPGQCVIQNYTQVDSDIWFCYTASCTDVVVVSLCGSSYDTKMMIYGGCGCPSSQPLTCSDDNCGTGQDSRAEFNAVQGQSYTIRIGGFEGATGNGQLTVFCKSDPGRGLNSCTGGTGDCFSAHANPGCATTTTCEQTCAVDPFCCDTEWDGKCGEKADGIVNGFDACTTPTAGSCFSGNTTPGCNEPPCCQSVCEMDPFCCTDEWDDICADSVGEVCGLFAVCSNGTGSCFSPHMNGGCNVESCCNAVCAVDPICCEDEWDDVCSEQAVELRQSGECR